MQLSPLSQKIESDGKSIAVEISPSGDGCWLLKVVDDFNNATVWEDAFPSEQAALDEVLDTIAQQGIECLAFSAPWQ